MSNLKNIKVYTDGSCKPSNPGPAGFGIIILENEKELHKNAEFLGPGTNNIAELKGVENALLYLKEQELNLENIEIITDSQYAIGLFTKNWKPKLNKKLVANIREMLTEFPNISFTWVKGHSGDEYNETVDFMAKNIIDQNSEII